MIKYLNIHNLKRKQKESQSSVRIKPELQRAIQYPFIVRYIEFTSQLATEFIATRYSFYSKLTHMRY